MANNKIYKNSVFVDLFSIDQTAPANFLSLYNALHGTHLTLAETTVDIRVLERTLYMGFKNDVSAIIDGRLIVLVEHQSTINENMPLRFLEYVAEFYKQLIPLRKRYYKSLVKIPRPEFYVLYNGVEDYPLEKELKLSDAFMENDFTENEKIPLEISVKVININKDRNSRILSRCNVLAEYSELIDLIRTEKATGNEKFYDEAINKALKGNLLKDYLERKRWEIENMTFAEYDYDMDIAAQREEAMEIGEQRGAYEKAVETARTAILMGMTQDVVAKLSGLPVAEIEQLQNTLKEQLIVDNN